MIQTLLARGMLIALGALGLGWGLFFSPGSWTQYRLDRLTDRIVAGAVVDAAELRETLPLLQAIDQKPDCNPAQRRSAAIVRMRLFDDAAADGDAARFDDHLRSLSNAVTRALSCAPIDAYLWLGHYWASVARDGFRPAHLSFLRMSYETGPREGWVAVRRSRYAFSIFEFLPPDLAASALREFADLLRSGLYAEAAGIFLGPAWPVKERILADIEPIPLRNREAFAAELARLGAQVAVPGVRQQEFRPWR